MFDPCKTFDPTNALHSGLGFFLQNLVATGHFQVISHLVDPGWPLHDFWPQQWVTHWPGVLPTKFGGHRAFLSNLTSARPWLTPAWPLTPAMSYALIRGSSYQIWQPFSISRQVCLRLTPADPCMTFDPSNALYFGQGFFPPNLVATGNC